MITIKYRNFGDTYTTTTRVNREASYETQELIYAEGGEIVEVI